jgi:hypothetical protein
MTTEVAGRRDLAHDRSRPERVSWQETKPSFLTTEFYAMIGAIAATLFAGENNTSWDDRWVWQVIGAIVIGYMLSRGLAKSGSVDRTRED